MPRTLLLHTALGRVLSVVGTGSAAAVGACGGQTDTSATATSGDSGAAGRAGSFGVGAAAGTAGSFGAGRGGAGGIRPGAGGAPPIAVDASTAGGSAGSDAGVECLEHLKASRHDLGPLAPESAEQACGYGPDGRSSYWDYVCFAAPADGGTCESSYEPGCVERAYSCGLSTRGNLLCGPRPPPDGSGLEHGACCYMLVGSCPVGRPFIVGSVARVAAAGSGEGWRTKLEPDVTTLDPETRAALADIYRQDGLTEHASVASFARFTLQCLALGAPAEIVHGAQRAGLEEVEHARLSFGLASAYSGRPERPLGIDVAGALASAVDARAVALSVTREGCIAETVSALLIAAARDTAQDPVVKRVLAEVAEQELEHALLAWRYLRWALEQGDRELRRSVAAVFAHPELAIGLGPTTSFAGCPRALRAHGCLPWAERHSIAADALRNVIAPAARALLAPFDREIGAGGAEMARI